MPNRVPPVFHQMPALESVFWAVSRRLRFVPEGGALVEVTSRTVHARYLLAPTEEFRSVVVGVLGRAQRLYGVALHAFVFMSNHYHLLVSVESAQQLARFMNYVNSNLAREAGRLVDWKDKFWSRRYQAIVVSEEEAAQVDRLTYLLSHGCKEDLVARPQDWPGAHSVEALLSGRPLVGRWINRTAECEARRRGRACGLREFATREMVELSPLPCWSKLPAEVCRRLVAELVEAVIEKTAARHDQDGSRPRGAELVLGQHPHDRPEAPKRAWAPPFHTVTKAARQALVEAYAWFVAAYREAAARLRSGKSEVHFPPGSFPPPHPFVRCSSEAVPG